MEIRAGYKNTEIGVIPKDWEVSKIEPLINLLTGFPFPSNKYSNSGIRLLRGSNIKRGATDWSEDITQYWSEIAPEIKKYLLKENDIVIAMDGSLVGRSFAQLSDNDLPSLLLQRVARIRTEKVNINFLKELVCSKYFTEHCDKVKTSSAIPHISPKDIKDYIIPLPPTIKEQTAIATVLSDTDSLIQALEKKIAKKQLIKKGALQKLLSPKKDWVVKTLGEIVYFLNGNAHEQFIKTDAEFTVINSKFVSTEGKVFKTSTVNLCPLKKGDIAMVMSDIPNGKALAKCYLVPEDDKYALNQRICCLRAENVVNVFLSLILNRNKYYLAFDSGTGQTNLKRSDVLNCPIPLPPTKQEQTRIAQILSDMDTEIEVLQKKLAKYKQLKQGLMQVLLTGKKRLNLDFYKD